MRRAEGESRRRGRCWRWAGALCWGEEKARAAGLASPEGMADGVIRSGGEKEPEQHQRTEKTSAGVLGAESNRAGAAEDSAQNGGRSESGSAGEALLVAAAAAEDKVPTNLSISSSSQRRSSISTANEQQQQQPPSRVLGGPPPLSKPPEDHQPVRRNFQIPRKSREKKGGSFPSPPFSTSLPSPFDSPGSSQTPHTAACKPCGGGGSAGEPILLSGFYIISLPFLFPFSLLFCHEEETKPKQKLGLNFSALKGGEAGGDQGLGLS